MIEISDDNYQNFRISLSFASGHNSFNTVHLESCSARFVAEGCSDWIPHDGVDNDPGPTWKHPHWWIHGLSPADHPEATEPCGAARRQAVPEPASASYWACAGDENDWESSRPFHLRAVATVMLYRQANVVTLADEVLISDRVRGVVRAHGWTWLMTSSLSVMTQ